MPYRYELNTGNLLLQEVPTQNIRSKKSTSSHSPAFAHPYYQQQNEIPFQLPRQKIICTAHLSTHALSSHFHMIYAKKKCY